jgi:phosphatidylglycerophosphate synthase
MANALTVLRLALAFPFAILMASDDPATAPLAGLILVIAVLTDLLDGPIARRSGTAGTRGQVLDHVSDAVFVAGGLAGAASRGAIPWLLPILVCLAFTQYVVDSRWARPVRVRGGGGLWESRLGRWNGILYFVPLAVDVLVRMDAGLPGALLRPIAWALVATTALSMVLRLARLRGPHGTVRRTPFAGRPDRPGH